MQGVGDVAGIESARAYPVGDFAADLLTELRAHGHGQAVFEPTGFVVDDVADQGVLLVDRLFRELQNTPDGQRRETMAARLEAALTPLPQQFAEVQPLLRSVLRPAGFTAAVTSPARRPWLRQLWPFIHELAVVETGPARRVVTDRDTERWGVGGEQLLAAARANIAALYPAQRQPEKVGHLLGDGTTYCDSAVLVPGWLGGFAGDGYRPLVFFPGDEVLLVCTDDPAVAPAFFAGAESVYRDAVVPISPQAYTIVGNTIVPLDAAGPSPLRPLAVRARSVLAATEYQLQADRLQGSDGTGAVQLIDTPRGLCTLTVWGQGSGWLLAETDYVMLVAADQSDHFTVPFGVLADIVGLVPAPAMIPARYPVTDWPPADTVETLRAHAVSLPGL